MKHKSILIQMATAVRNSVKVSDSTNVCVDQHPGQYSKLKSCNHRKESRLLKALTMLIVLMVTKSRVVEDLMV